MTIPDRPLNDHETFVYAAELAKAADGAWPIVALYETHEPRWVEEARQRGILKPCNSCDVSAKPHYHIDQQKYLGMPKRMRR